MAGIANSEEHMLIITFVAFAAAIATLFYAATLLSRLSAAEDQINELESVETRVNSNVEHTVSALASTAAKLSTRTAEVHEAREAAAMTAEALAELRIDRDAVYAEYQRATNILIDIERRMGADLEAIDVKHAAEVRNLKNENKALIEELEARAEDLESATDRIIALEMELESHPVDVIVKKKPKKKLVLKKRAPARA